MFISRDKYEKELKKAYDKGYDEAFERTQRDIGFERIWTKLHELENKIHEMMPKQGSADNETCARVNLF